MKKFRFHLPQLPHLVINDANTACAFSEKIRKFARMMMQRGHEVIFYGHAASQVQCTEHVVVTDDDVLAASYADQDHKRSVLKYSNQDSAYQEFTRRMIPEIQARAQALDFLCCPFGNAHQAVAQAVEPLGVIVCETGIGYSQGHFARWRCYESHAIRAAVEGARVNQDWYSWVIPNYFELSDFEYQRKKQDYVLYLGRVTEHKGITTCVRACEAAGVELRIAGQGSLADLGYEQTPEHVRELGYADRALRRELLSNASALIIASNYLEPFGGVAVEALLSGTPIITPFFGAFEEINIDGVTGFKCHNLHEYVEAIRARRRISPSDCRSRGSEYLTTEIAPKFEAWFQAIHEVYTGSGWDQL